MNADLGGEDSRRLIAEDGFTTALASTYETLFTTGHRYLDPRGSLEEGREGAPPGLSCAVSLVTTTPRFPTWSRHPAG